MLRGYPELIRDIFEVFGESHNFFYQWITFFVDLIGLLEQHVPLRAFLVPARRVLLGRVDMSLELIDTLLGLELIDTLLAVDLAIVGALLDAALVFLGFTSATAFRHLYNLSLIA
jgi:hypothetical protein